jgi:uncharacterized membrane protein YqjE
MAKDNAETAETDSGRAPGLLASLQRLLGSFAEILHTRVDILSTEIEEAGLILRQLAVYALVAFFFIGLGLLLATLFVVKSSPEIYQLYVLGGFALLYLLLGVIAVLLIRRTLRTRQRLFATTLAELDKDRQRLGNRS